MKRNDPVEIAAIAVPVLLEVVAVLLFIGMAAVWAALATGQVPV